MPLPFVALPFLLLPAPAIDQFIRAKKRYYNEQFESDVTPIRKQMPATNNGMDDAADAFRHTYAAARSTQQYGEKLTHFLGDMNEVLGDLNGAELPGKNMDLWNNAVGRKIGQTLGPDATHAEIAQAVYEAYLNGELIVGLDDPRRVPDSEYVGYGPLELRKGLEQAAYALGGLPVTDWPGALPKILKDAWELASTARVPRGLDPLILDLDGNGTIDTMPADGRLHFDLDASGFAESTGWTGARDGFLVRDLNHNGQIDTGRELFGDQTVLPSGELAKNGFDALAALDSNNDGRIDASDASWGDLRIWRDQNGNGKSDDGELLTPEQAGITAINTASTASGFIDSAGNTRTLDGTFVRADGSSGLAGSYLLNRNVTDSLATDWLPESGDTLKLPDLDGWGTVRTLHQAMLRDASLLTQVEHLTNSTDFKHLRADFEAMVRHWTSADQIAQTSRGDFIDAQKLAVIEAFYGQQFEGADGHNPNSLAAPLLTAAYTSLIDTLYAQFLAQAQLSSVWSKLVLAGDFESPGMSFDYSGVIATLTEMLGSGSPTTTVQLLYEFGKSAAKFGLDAYPEFQTLKEAFSGTPYNYDKVLQGGIDNLPLLLGTSGIDTLTLNSKGIIFSFDGNDSLVGSTFDDVLQGGLGADNLYGNDGNDVLFGDDGNDTLDGGRGADTLIGGAGDDVLGGAANSADAGWYAQDMYGTWSYRDPGAGNVYNGGTGNDVLNGTSRADLYLFNRGDGADTINEVEVIGQPTGQEDVLRFGAGITESDVNVIRNGNDLLLQLVDSSDQVTIKNWFLGGNMNSTSYQIERVEFADGTSWTADELTTMGLTQIGTEGNDVLTGLSSYANVLDGDAGDDVLTGGALDDVLLGGAGNDRLFGNDGNDRLNGGIGNDTLDGGRGADLLVGGAGDDVLGGAPNSADAGWYAQDMYGTWNYRDPGAGNTYIGGTGNDILNGTSRADLYLFNRGDGADTINEVEVTGQPSGQVDVLRFGGDISKYDINVLRSGNDLLLQISDSADQVTIKNWFLGGSASSTAYQVESVEFADGTSWTAADLTTMALNQYGSPGNDTLTGLSGYANIIHGGEGNDTLVGGNLNDLLFGDAGDDVLYGGAGLNELTGGTGQDVLYGGIDRDIFHFGLGAGGDTVWSGGGADVLDFDRSGMGHPLSVVRQGNDIKFSYSSSDYVVVKDWFSPSNGMQVTLPNGVTKTAAEINAGFTSTVMGWESGVYNTRSTNFVDVVRGLHSEFSLLDTKYQSTWGQSFYGSVFGSGTNTGTQMNGQTVYSWSAGMGNQYATPNKPIYGDVTWNFWSDGQGGTNFVITSASAGNITNGWSYSAGSPGALANTTNVARQPLYTLSNPMHPVSVTSNQYELYHGEGPTSYQLFHLYQDGDSVVDQLAGLGAPSGHIPADYVLNDAGVAIVGAAPIADPMYV